jgi:hypothetical protein
MRLRPLAGAAKGAAMYDDYDEVGTVETIERATPDIQAAASVFECIMEEMGVDPLDRRDWLGRFIAGHRAATAREAVRVY